MLRSETGVLDRGVLEVLDRNKCELEGVEDSGLIGLE